MQVRGRLAYLINPAGKVDPRKRWVYDFPFWLAINDGFGEVAHGYYVEQLLAAGSTLPASTSGLPVAAPPRRPYTRNSMIDSSRSTGSILGFGRSHTATAA
jgi:hypothetical protein